ncbi:MAG: hypothetical protein KGH66_00590 [Candidatus Micrarchaeota archaeon]|nr:hypothetical protein [Candidatus Micrarchaeota archaeon]
MSDAKSKQSMGAYEREERNRLLNDPTPTSIVLFMKRYPHYIMTEDLILWLKTKDPVICMCVVNSMLSMPKEERAGHLNSGELVTAIEEYVVSISTAPKDTMQALKLIRGEEAWS